LRLIAAAAAESAAAVLLSAAAVAESPAEAWLSAAAAAASSVSACFCETSACSALSSSTRVGIASSTFPASTSNDSEPGIGAGGNGLSGMECP